MAPIQTRKSLFSSVLSTRIPNQSGGGHFHLDFLVSGDVALGHPFLPLKEWLSWVCPPNPHRGIPLLLIFRVSFRRCLSWTLAWFFWPVEPSMVTENYLPFLAWFFFFFFKSKCTLKTLKTQELYPFFCLECQKLIINNKIPLQYYQGIHFHLREPPESRMFADSSQVWLELPLLLPVVGKCFLSKWVEW